VAAREALLKLDSSQLEIDCRDFCGNRTKLANNQNWVQTGCDNTSAGLLWALK
jgi:hypothetical protein